MWSNKPFMIALFGQAGYDIAHKLVGEGINSFLGAAIVGTTEIILSLFYFLFFYKPVAGDPLFTGKGLGFAVMIGVCAWLIDVPLLASYKAGFDLTKAAPFIVTGALTFSTLFGLAVLRESVTDDKLLGIVLGIVSCYLILRSG